MPRPLSWVSRTTVGGWKHLDLVFCRAFSDEPTSIHPIDAGTWRKVDLSYNNLAAGSSLVISELADILGKKAAEFVSVGSYGMNWDLERLPAGQVREPVKGRR